MRTLTPAERRALRAKAHPLHPFVAIGQHGLTPAVLHEIELALAAHALIKIRIFNDDRGEREALLARICDALDAAPVQHLGKVLTLWRPLPAPAAPVATPRKRPSAGGGKAGRAKPPDGDRRRRTAPAAPRAKSPAATAGGAASRRRKPPPGGGRASTLGDASRARRRQAARDPDAPPRASANPFVRRGAPSAAGHDPAKRPPRGGGSGKPRNRGSAATGAASPRASPTGPRRRRTPR